MEMLVHPGAAAQATPAPPKPAGKIPFATCQQPHWFIRIPAPLRTVFRVFYTYTAHPIATGEASIYERGSTHNDTINDAWAISARYKTLAGGENKEASEISDAPWTPLGTSE
jgi:hypothetical protein